MAGQYSTAGLYREKAVLSYRRIVEFRSTHVTK